MNSNDELNQGENFEPSPLQFQVWRLVAEHWGTLAMIGVSIGLAFLVETATDSRILAMIVFLLLQRTLLSVYLPTSYSIGGQGIEIKNLVSQTSISWGEIDHYRPLTRGFLLFPQRESYPLEALRGQYIAVPEKDYASVVQWLEFNGVEKLN